MSVRIHALRHLAPVPPSVTQYSEGWLGFICKPVLVVKQARML
jgi:hypothetical protein